MPLDPSLQTLGNMYTRNLVPAQADQTFAEAIQALRTAFASDDNKL